MLHIVFYIISQIPGLKKDLRKVPIACLDLYADLVGYFSQDDLDPVRNVMKSFMILLAYTWS